ncbi:MAG: transcriptional regulator [Deltaproteobacteria bacterium]|nr:transcriptional regulator [Deltaproteobacteria bacterium]
MKAAPVPKERKQTVRQLLEDLLRGGGAPKTLLELATGAKIRERDAAEHLEHLIKSGKAKGVKVAVEPARCLDCDFSFKKRDKLTTPGKCPVCGSERISNVRFSIED